ncbi:MAG: cytochrome C [Gammaproteobacteria bacterium]|nr:cytochrome C [Gammaproteobacteria bacterium]
MKKVFLGLVGVIALVVGAGALYYSLLLPKQHPPSDIRVELTPAKIERGRYLVINVLQCVDCHSERDWNLYGGPPMEPVGAGRECFDRNTRVAGVNVGEESFPGRMCMRNITQDTETGIGAWTDGEIIRAVREGIGREGQGLFPIMPYFIYRNVSDADMEAVVAYLRTMEPVESLRPEREVDFPMSTLIQLFPEPLDGPVPMPARDDPLAYGEYLSVVSRCQFCHTPRNPRSMEGKPGRKYAGGMPFFLGGNTLYSFNLTPHESGLGSWTREQFIQRFKMHSAPQPVRPENNTLMNWNAFAGMTEDDLGMLYDYFMTLTPVPLELEPI